jgi:TolB protein
VGQGRIAFTSYDSVRQQYDIYSVESAHGSAKLLRESASQPAFAPDGRRLVFRNHDPFHLGLGILDLSTNQVHELTPFAEDTAPAWSPNAQHIAFASDKHGDRKWRIYAISPGKVRGEGEEWTLGQTPAWSPDGSQVAYHGCDERGDNCGVRLIKAGGFDPRRLTTDPSDTAPSWSPGGAPGGTQVAFISARSGNWELYLVDTETGQETRLTNHPATDVAPTWSPNGRQLAFLSDRDGTWALYTLELSSGDVQKVIATGDAYPEPVGERLSWAR